MILKILTISNPDEALVLRSKSTDVISFDEELRTLSQNMIETMFAADGVGIAAPQVGINLNLFIVRTPESIKNNSSDPNKDALVVINPVMKVTHNDFYNDKEGCLSIPGVVGMVRRHRELSGTFYDVYGQQKTLPFTSLQARIWQHENDHLSGQLFTDIATQVKNR